MLAKINFDYILENIIYFFISENMQNKDILKGHTYILSFIKGGNSATEFVSDCHSVVGHFSNWFSRRVEAKRECRIYQRTVQPTQPFRIFFFFSFLFTFIFSYWYSRLLCSAKVVLFCVHSILFYRQACYHRPIDAFLCILMAQLTTCNFKKLGLFVCFCVDFSVCSHVTNMYRQFKHNLNN